LPGLLCMRFHDYGNVHILSPAFRYSADANSAFTHKMQFVEPAGRHMGSKSMVAAPL